MQGLLGKKAGMTQLFLKDNSIVPVTIVEMSPNVVLQVKNKETDGYVSTKLGYDKVEKLQRVNRPDKGQFKKVDAEPVKFIKEIRNMSGFNAGDKISADKIFTEGMFVDVTGTSKGKGFQGAIKRHNQSRGPMGHGSKFHRAPGSIGDIRSTVKKGMPMPGHMGHDTVTIQNLEIILVDIENNILAIKGAIPGPNKGYVIVKENAKQIKSNSNPVDLVNVKEEIIKNHLLEEGKKVGANINTEQMTISEIKAVIEEATKAKAEYEKKHKVLLEEAKSLGVKEPKKMDNETLEKEIQTAKEVIAKRKKSEEAENNQNVTQDNKSNNEEVIADSQTKEENK